MRLIIWMVLLGLGGCGPADLSAIKEEVLKTDPKFQAVLDEHEGYASQIETAEKEFTLKRSTVDRTIQRLRQDLAESRKAVRKKKARYRELMEPERRRVEFSMSMAREELRAKRVQRSSVGRSIARLRKALDGADETWSPQERRRQEVQLEEMLRDAQRLDEEITSIKEHVRFLRLKLRLIQI